MTPPTQIIPEVAGENWWLPAIVPVTVLDRTIGFDFNSGDGNGAAAEIHLPPSVGAVQTAARGGSDDYIISYYGLRTEIVPFAGNYLVAALDKGGGRARLLRASSSRERRGPGMRGSNAPGRDQGETRPLLPDKKYPAKTRPETP